MWTDRLRSGALQRQRLLCHPHRSEAIADLHVALPQWADDEPAAQVSKPIRSGQAFVSIRSIVPSPFADGRIYYGGYDCNFYPADGTAWVATSTLSSLHLSVSSKGDVMRRQRRSPRTWCGVAMASGSIAILALALSACSSSPSRQPRLPSG